MSVKSAQQAITATTTTTKVKIETPQSMKKVAEDLYSFEDEIENINISIFKAVRHSNALSPEDERAKAIANLYDFDLNESLDKKNCRQDRSLVDDKDLVSKRLKETILQNEQFSKTVLILIVIYFLEFIFSICFFLILKLRLQNQLHADQCHQLTLSTSSRILKK